MTTLAGKRATVVGLGIEGVALVRYLAAQGAQVTVSDAKPAEALQENLARIAGAPVRLSLGGNYAEACLDADVLFVSQGVPLDIPTLVTARERGIPFSSSTKLFMDHCPAPILGITGSAGKSTTTALTGELFKAAGGPVMVGGNIGLVLLDNLDQLTPDHWVVLEVSHTQLELTDRSPRIAVVTNISPSHADRYPSLDQYIALKERLFQYQGPEDGLVLNWEDQVTRAMAGKAQARIIFFSDGEIPSGDATYLRDGQIWLRYGGTEQAIVPIDRIKPLGAHNVANALAACAAGAAAELPIAAMAQGVANFRGLAHRLEWVGQAAGVNYYNDSIATTPVRTIAGLQSFARPIVLLAGGKDKALPLGEWVDEVCRRCAAVVLFGEAGPMLQAALGTRWQGRAPLVYAPQLPEAVAKARSLAESGDVVLLSPACTSFDQYPNFEVRGRHFAELVTQFAHTSTMPADEGSL